MKKRTTKVAALLASACMIASFSLTGCGGSSANTVAESTAATEAASKAAEETTTQAEETKAAAADTGNGTTPRNETLYFSGQQWGAINSWNPIGGNSNNAMAVTQRDGSRITVYETLFMYNMMDNDLHPLLGTEYSWDDDKMSAMTIKLNPDAHWSDGTPLTAADVEAAFNYNVWCESSYGVEMTAFMESVTAVDDHTVSVKAVLGEDGYAKDPNMIKQWLSKMYVLQKAYLEEVEKRSGSYEDMKMDKMEDFVSSGPYRSFFHDENKVVLVRDDNYWGQADSMWGKLPTPKYLAQNIYKDNGAALIAFEQGEVDISQSFNTDVQKLWEEKGLPITTYIDEAPYNIATTIPTLWYNMEKPGLDRVEVRKAIAMAVDYDQILSAAISNQAPSFKDVPRSMMNPTEPEQALIDHEALADLQWVGNDVDGANKLLDDAGIVDTDGDGIREADGVKLSFKAECPSGYTDWQATLEIVAASAKKIGIEIETYFPEITVWNVDQSTLNFDMIMVKVTGASITNPVYRCKQFLYGPFADGEVNFQGNYGHYRNAEADEILEKLPTETDQETLKKYYTRLNEIYLTDVPSFGLMYRPDMFYTVNESVWTGYPLDGDGTNVPPLVCMDGYGIAGLYNLKLVEE